MGATNVSQIFFPRAKMQSMTEWDYLYASAVLVRSDMSQLAPAASHPFCTREETITPPPRAEIPFTHLGLPYTNTST